MSFPNRKCPYIPNRRSNPSYKVYSSDCLKERRLYVPQMSTRSPLCREEDRYSGRVADSRMGRDEIDNSVYSHTRHHNFGSDRPANIGNNYDHRPPPLMEDPHERLRNDNKRYQDEWAFYKERSPIRDRPNFVNDFRNDQAYGRQRSNPIIQNPPRRQESSHPQRRSPLITDRSASPRNSPLSANLRISTQKSSPLVSMSQPTPASNNASFSPTNLSKETAKNSQITSNDDASLLSDTSTVGNMLTDPLDKAQTETDANQDDLRFDSSGILEENDDLDDDSILDIDLDDFEKNYLDDAPLSPKLTRSKKRTPQKMDSTSDQKQSKEDSTFAESKLLSPSTHVTGNEGKSSTPTTSTPKSAQADYFNYSYLSQILDKPITRSMKVASNAEAQYKPAISSNDMPTKTTSERNTKSSDELLKIKTEKTSPESLPVKRMKRRSRRSTVVSSVSSQAITSGENQANEKRLPRKRPISAKKKKSQKRRCENIKSEPFDDLFSSDTSGNVVAQKIFPPGTSQIRIPVDDTSASTNKQVLNRMTATSPQKKKPKQTAAKSNREKVEGSCQDMLSSNIIDSESEVNVSAKTTSADLPIQCQADTSKKLPEDRSIKSNLQNCFSVKPPLKPILQSPNNRHHLVVNKPAKSVRVTSQPNMSQEIQCLSDNSREVATNRHSNVHFEGEKNSSPCPPVVNTTTSRNGSELDGLNAVSQSLNASQENEKRQSQKLKEDQKPLSNCQKKPISHPVQHRSPRSSHPRHHQGTSSADPRSASNAQSTCNSNQQGLYLKVIQKETWQQSNSDGIDHNNNQCHSENESQDTQTGCDDLLAMDKEYEMLDVYAPDEDCISLYSNARINRNSKPVSRIGKKSKDNIVQTEDNTKAHNSKSRETDDIIEDQNKKSITLINALLNFNSLSQTLMAVETFFQAFLSQKNIAVYTELIAVAKRLGKQLSQFNQMNDLLKLAKLTVNMRVLLEDDVLDKLFLFLKQGKNNQSITSIITQIGKRDLLTGDEFASLVRKWAICDVNNNTQLQSPWQQRCSVEINDVCSDNGHDVITPTQRVLQKLNEKHKESITERLDFHAKHENSREQYDRHVYFEKNPVSFKRRFDKSKERQRGDQHEHFGRKTYSRDRLESFGNRHRQPNEYENDTGSYEPINSSEKLKRGSYPLKFKTISVNRKPLPDQHEEYMNSRTGGGSNKSTRINHYKNIEEEEVVDGREDKDECLNGLALKIKNAAQRRDWSTLGRNFGELVGIIGSHSIEDNLLLAFVGTMTLRKTDNVSIFIKFAEAAEIYVKHACPEDFDMLRSCLTRIGITLVHNCQSQLAYNLILYLRETKADVVGLAPISEEMHSKMSPCNNALKFIQVCMQMKDCKMAAKFAGEFFLENSVEVVGPVQGQTVGELLQVVTRQCLAMKEVGLAVKCVQAIPINYSQGNEVVILEQILRLILSNESDCAKTAESLKIVADQMLSRNLLLPMRFILNESPLNGNILTLFKYIETKGIYNCPRIARRPHLVLIPWTMGPIEMTLVLYRHLLELSLFLMEIEKKMTNRPLKVVLVHDVGHLVELKREKQAWKDSYGNARRQLLDTFRKYIKPPLKLQSCTEVQRTKEVMFNFDIDSVRKWLFENTAYTEKFQKRSNGNIQLNDRRKQSVTNSVLNVLNDHMRQTRQREAEQLSPHRSPLRSMEKSRKRESQRVRNR